MKQEKYLPIGSVCTLKGKNKKVMITGYYSVEFKGNLTIKDYVGCAYPEGLLLPELTCNFNHDDIENIDFIGYINEEQEKFKGLLNRLTGNVSEEEKAKEFHKNNDMFLTSNASYSKLLFDENGVVMIAETAKPEVKENKTLEYTFDENGVVISVNNYDNVSNPFKYNSENSPKVVQQNDWSILNDKKIDNSNELENRKTIELNKIEFDENGVVISVGSSESNNNKTYEFDENGVVVSVGTVKNESSTEDKKIPNYKFDENGVVISE